jgi:cysteine desulfurase
MSASPAVYLDFAASTPCDPRVVEAMLPFFTQTYGNPANRVHAQGLHAHLAVEQARERAARLIGCLPGDVIWTSGATEANNLAIRGFAKAGARRGTDHRRHLVTALHEHQSVLATCRELERDGWAASYLRPQPSGTVTAEMVEHALRPDTSLVCVMAANNELGTLNEVASIGELCRRRGIVFHCDATQWVGKLPLDVSSMHVDMLSWSGHKIYGPKGVGALFVRSNPPLRLAPIAYGGGQERGLRPGTVNVPAVVGFGVACEICRPAIEREATRLGGLRDRLEATLVNAVDGAVVNGLGAPRVPHITSVTFPLDSDHDLVQELGSIECSSGSACSRSDPTPSHVLRSIGIHGRRARGTLRLSVGRPTASDDIERATDNIARVLGRLTTPAPRSSRTG